MTVGAVIIVVVVVVVVGVGVGVDGVSVVVVVAVAYECCLCEEFDSAIHTLILLLVCECKHHHIQHTRRHTHHVAYMLCEEIDSARCVCECVRT